MDARERRGLEGQRGQGENRNRQAESWFLHGFALEPPAARRDLIQQ